MQSKRCLAVAALLAGATLAGQHAQANLVTDGNFTSFSAVTGHSGSGIATNNWPSSPWSVSGGTAGSGNFWFYGLNMSDGDPDDPTDNAMDASSTTPAGVGSLSQTISTTAGDDYTLSFDYNSGDGGSSEFNVGLTNADDFSSALPSGEAPLSLTWETLSYTFQATSTSSNLSFTMYNNFSNTEITDVSVVANVPEPVLLLPVLLAGAMMRRAARQPRPEGEADYPKI